MPSLNAFPVSPTDAASFVSVHASPALRRKEVAPLNRVFAAAKKHGLESEAGHEAGDLHDFILACWAAMTPAQREAALAEHEEDNEWYADAGGATGEAR